MTMFVRFKAISANRKCQLNPESEPCNIYLCFKGFQFEPLQCILIVNPVKMQDCVRPLVIFMSIVCLVKITARIFMSPAL